MTTETTTTNPLQGLVQKALQFRTDRLAAATEQQDEVDFWNDIRATEIGGLNPTSTGHTFNPANFNLAKARQYIDNSHLKGGGGGNYFLRDALGLLGSSDPTGLSDHDVWELYQKGFGSIPTGFANPYAQTSTNNNTGTGDGTGDGTGTETPSYLTADDLSSWWEGIDKSGWGGKKEEAEPKGMDDFMKFMMFMSMMRPQRSGGGSQYGYGGLKPGGVISHHNPLNNISQLVSAFGQLPGSNSSTT